jgi:fatty acid desaturase
MVTVQGMRLMLLVFAAVGFAGAGAALAVIRSRMLVEGERDLGLTGIAAMFALFGALCTVAASGVFGVIAFGGVVVWASYVIMARHLGLFIIEARSAPPPERERTRHHSG